MQKVFKGFLSLCLAVAVCVSTSVLFNTANSTVADAATDYYAGITATGGTKLSGQLHDLIVSTHKTYTSYDDCKKYGPTTDPSLDGKSGVMEFYTHETIAKFVGGVGDWNREHVWCQSLSNGLWGTGGAGSDLHHIRPSESGLNSIRGNNKYGKVSGGKEAWSRDNSKNNSKLGGYVGGGTFEPLDNVKGDVARIVMYVYLHYNNASTVGGTIESAKTKGNLPFRNVVTASSEAAAIKLLLEWNALDPVDKIETYRNEAVYEIQGNRNPFIDNSSYAEAIWGDGTTVTPDPGPGTNPEPSNTLKNITLNPSALNLKTGDIYDLKVIPNPSNASSSVTWVSSNDSVATVSNGKITAKTSGTVTITATSTVNSAIKATATVTVRQTSSSEAATGKATITRDSFGDASGGYDFQDWSAGSIEGIAYIYGGKKDSMQFNTSKDSYFLASTTATPAPIKSITVKSDGEKSNKSWKLLTTSWSYGEVKGAPTNGNNQGSKTVTGEGVTWTVNGTDTYFALVLEGDGAGYLDSIVVEYGADSSSGTDELQELIINPLEFTLSKGEKIKLSAEAIPSNASADVTWSSSDTSVATVSADGTVTAVAVGNATITATSKTKSAVTASATVTVTETTFVAGNDKVNNFHNAVAAITEDGTLAEWHSSLNAAINAYNTLAESDKAEVAADIESLRSSIASYNETMQAYNDAADSAEKTALKGMGR